MRLFPYLYFIAATWNALATKTRHPNGIEVGFNLGYTYGTAAISYPDGTLVGVARLKARPEYQQFLERLSLWSSTHPAPPYDDLDQKLNDWQRQQIRKARKAAGLPASKHVAAISTLVKALKEAAEEELGFEIKAAAASVPHFPAIYDEDLYDSFEYAGLEYLQIMASTAHSSYLTYETAAALAGHGLSVCHNITDIEVCQTKEGEPSGGVYLIVDYTRSNLLVYHTDAEGESGAYEVFDYLELSLELGSDARYAGPSEDYYWEEVRKVLLKPLLHESWQVPTEVILVGEKAADPAFRKVLDEVLGAFYKDEGALPPIIDRDPEYIQAKGVAEFVRRRPYMQRPWKPEGVLKSLRDGRDRSQRRIGFDQNEL